MQNDLDYLMNRGQSSTSHRALTVPTAVHKFKASPDMCQQQSIISRADGDVWR